MNVTATRRFLWASGYLLGARNASHPARHWKRESIHSISWSKELYNLLTANHPQKDVFASSTVAGAAPAEGTSMALGRERERDPVVIFQWHTVPNRKSWVNHQKWELTIKNWEMRCLIPKNRGHTIKNGGFTIKNGGFTTDNRVPQLGTKALSWGSSLCARAWWGLAAWIPVGTASDTEWYG